MKTTVLNVAHLFLRVCAGLLVGATALSLADGWAYGAQAAAARPLYMVAAFGLVAWFAAFRHTRLAAASATCFVVAALGTASPPDAIEGTCGRAPLRLLVVNALVSNPTPGRLDTLAADTLADIVVVSELRDPLHRALAARYPFQASVDVGGTSGLGVYSRFPLDNVEIVRGPIHKTPAMAVRVAMPGRPFALFAIHPLPPNNPSGFSDRKFILDHAAERTRRSTGPMIVAGDFNTPPWSPDLAPLYDHAARVHTPGTWPTLSPVRTPIDHVFLKGFGVCESAVLTDDFGSDHLPVLVEIRRDVPSEAMPEHR